MSRRTSLPSPLQVSRKIGQQALLRFPPTVVAQLALIEKDLGGRQALVGLLSLAALTPDQRYVLGLLGDPDCDGQTLAEICTLGNILPGELLSQLTVAAQRLGKVRAAQIVAAGTPAVVDDIMRRAAPYEESCPTCQGVGSITADPTPTTPNPSPAPCQICAGGGRLRYPPDLERQKLAVDLAQLLPKGGGLNIALQQNNGLAGSGGSSTGMGLAEKLDAFMDQLLYADQPPPPAGTVDAVAVAAAEVEAGAAPVVEAEEDPVRSSAGEGTG